MKGRIKQLLFIVNLFLIMCCSNQKTLTPLEYIQWVNNPDNGLVHEKEIDEFNFILQYRPVDYMVAHDLLSTQVAIGKEGLDSLYHKYEGLQYFVLKIGAPQSGKDFLLQSIQSEQEYYDRIQYFSTSAQQDIYLIESGDTLRCALYHFERVYSVGSYNNLLLGFENKNKPVMSKTLYYNDHVLGVGKVIFTISEKQLTHIPKLETI